MTAFNFYVVLTFIIIYSSTLSSCQQCAQLYKSSGNESLFSMRDESRISNFEDVYVGTLESDIESWSNLTTSFTIEAGCKLMACSESHFNGKCKSFVESSTSLPSEMNTILSANCNCNIESECSCSNIPMRKTNCARGYLKGCNICNPEYFNMKKNHAQFPDKEIQSIQVREGCILDIYKESDFNGDFTRIEETDENFRGKIGSYECDCIPSFGTRMKSPRNPNYPAFVDVPSSIDKISSMITGDYGKHPGLMAALKSLKNKRSSKNAYILLLGSTGSGKSTAINLLFDNPNITRVGGMQSTTTDIHEFRIPVPIDELGIRNSEIRVIDTPGLGDTRGLEQDAKFLATLDDYLETHEELHNRIPNIVLIFHKFNDNRFNGESSTYVKMLRVLDSMRKQISDESYSNIIFVLSHFSSSLESSSKKSKIMLRKFKQVIESYTQFPKPIIITVAENKGDENDLTMVNGYHKLPNGEFYPRNLFDNIQVATSSGGDPIGDALIRSAFKNSDDFNASCVDFPLVSEDHSKVSKYLSILVSTEIKVENTEVSQLLTDANDRMDIQLKSKHSMAVTYLQKALNIRDVRTKADVPKTTIGILELLSSLQQNEAVLYLLEEGLKLNPPLFPHDVVTGHSYTIFRDTTLPKAPFKLLEKVINSDIGYLFPSVMTCTLQNHVEDFFKIDAHREDYLMNRFSSLGIQGSIPQEKFSGVIKPGFNIQNETMLGESCVLSALREFRTFELVLNDKLKLTEEFTTVLKTLSAFNESDHENVQVWNNLFNDYGTHVVKQVYGGGSIEINLKSNSSCDGQLAQTLFELVQFAEDITIIKDNSTSDSLKKQGVDHKLKFKGGDQAYHTQDLTEMSLEEASNLLKNWKKSLKLSPVILTTEMQLLPLSEVAKDKSIGQNISSEIQRATSLLFNSSLTYLPPSKSKGPGDRDSVTILDSYNQFNILLQTFLNQSQEAQEKFDRMMESIRVHQNEFENRTKYEEEMFEQSLKEQEKIQTDNSKLDKGRWESNQRNRQERMEEKIRREQEMARRAREEEIRRKEEIELMKRIKREHENRMEELRRRMEANKPRRSGGSCLKSGTKILLASTEDNNDGMILEKSVEQIKVGDVLLDSEMKPTRVLGISKEFLMEQTFFGFDNETFFFTDSHIFVGPKVNTKKDSSYDATNWDLQYYTQDLERLLEQNPLMRYIEPYKMDTDKGFNVYKFNALKKSMGPKKVKPFKNPIPYAEDTLVYFIQVDSPTGTYFANGYVCRHEIPPVTKWPNTMAILLKLSSYSEIQFLNEIPYNLESLGKINKVVSDVEEKVRESLMYLSVKNLTAGETIMELEEKDLYQSINDIFNHPSFSAFGMGTYGSLSEIMATYLDDFEPLSDKVRNKISIEYLGCLQKWLWEIITKQVSISIRQQFI